ncbi:MAG: hypothetical protein ACKVWV_16165 [Planctomycetota bacterium]
MQTRDTGDCHAWLVVDGKTVVKTKRSHGRGDVLHNKVRTQLKLNERELQEAVDCTLSRAGYVEILRAKGVL